jgi:hypothetical protein
VADDTIVMTVKVNLHKMKFICIHPQNDSMPVFTMKLDSVKLNYGSYADHDVIDGQLANFRIFDNTNYPNTLNPYKQYTPSDKVKDNIILEFKTRKQPPLKKKLFESPETS